MSSRETSNTGKKVSFYKVKNVTNTGAFGEQWVGSVSQENKKKRGRGGGGGGGGGVGKYCKNIAL